VISGKILGFCKFFLDGFSDVTGTPMGGGVASPLGVATGGELNAKGRRRRSGLRYQSETEGVLRRK